MKWKLSGRRLPIARFVTLTGMLLAVTGAAPAAANLVAGSATPALYASDTFARVVSSGWGTADVGGSYSYNGMTSPFSVDGTHGVVTLAGGQSVETTLPGTSAENVDGTMAFTLTALPSRGELRPSLVLRSTGTSSLATEYRALASVGSDGNVQLYWRKSVVGKVTTLALVSTGLTVAPGKSYVLRARAIGSDPTTLELKLWPQAMTEPSGWTLAATDSEPRLQQAGAIGVHVLESAKRAALATVRLNQLTATAVPTADTTTPTSPAGLATSNITQSGFDVAWSASSDAGVTGYGVYLDGGEVAVQTGTGYSFTGLGCGTSHVLGVQSLEGSQVSALTTITASTLACSTQGLRSDPAIDSDPTNLWGIVQAASASRYQQFPSGGPNNDAYRRLTVQDGDDFYGERTELGANDSRYGLASPSNPSGTFWIYRPGTHAVTSLWMRLPTSFPISTPNWQAVLQMKQTQPYAAANISSPILSIEARDGRWNLMTNGNILWAGPTATLGTWTQLSLDVTYQKTGGSVQFTVGGVSSPVFSVPTLAYATTAGSGYAVGDPIPSHLRIGIYHNAIIPGTSVDIADVNVSP